MKYEHAGILRHNEQSRIEYSHVLEDYYFCIEEEAIYIHKLNGLKARI